VLADAIGADDRPGVNPLPSNIKLVARFRNATAMGPILSSQRTNFCGILKVDQQTATVRVRGTDPCTAPRLTNVCKGRCGADDGNRTRVFSLGRFSRRRGTASGDDRVNVRPVRGQFGCYLVWPLDLPPVPAFEFAEARA